MSCPASIRPRSASSSAGRWCSREYRAYSDSESTCRNSRSTDGLNFSRIAAVHRLSTCPVPDAHSWLCRICSTADNSSAFPFHYLVDNRLRRSLLVRLRPCRGRLPGHHVGHVRLAAPAHPDIEGLPGKRIGHQHMRGIGGPPLRHVDIACVMQFRGFCQVRARYQEPRRPAAAVLPGRPPRRCPATPRSAARPGWSAAARRRRSPC